MGGRPSGLNPGQEGKGTALCVLKRRRLMPAHQDWSSPQVSLSAGKLGIWSGVMLGAIAGAGITTLFALCLCLIFFGVKSCRRRASRKAVGVDGSHPVVEPAPLDCQQQSKSDLPADPTSSAGVPPTLEMDQELYYASISFHRMKEDTYAE
ncbi:myeloid cell surface antigen CD33-like [Mirounga leonina]|uniref:myeloid cell surface antigen CD33-like n=1 Tax=Mirounga leonina TaxID=9715 RepID=UPI00156C079C|nr:myeloid cell surface antigen CD33-like [Mirounga leonina]